MKYYFCILVLIIPLAFYAQVVLPAYQGVHHPGFACGKDSITDYDGNKYATVQIGEQCWMKQNLRCLHDADGNSITRLCYNNEPDSCLVYGGLYTWVTVMNGALSSNSNPSGVQGICPDGWHVPSHEEWKELEVTIGLTPAEADVINSWRGTIEGGKLKHTGARYWNAPNFSATNETNFTALGCGFYNNNSLSFNNLHVNVFYWTATENSTDEALFRALGYNQSNIANVDWDKERGLSLRCVKD